MRKILIIGFFILSGVFAGLVALPTILSVFGLDRYIANYVEKQLNKNGKQAVILGSVNLSWSSIYVDEAKFIDQAEGSSITISGIRFGYDVFRLVSNMNNPLDAVNQVYLVEPTVVLRSDFEEDNESATPVDTVVKRIRTIWKYFDNIDRIQLTDGRIILQRKNNSMLTLAQNLDGWLQNSDSASIYINAEGGLLNSSSENITLKCKIDPNRKRYSADLYISDLELPSIGDIKEISAPQFQDGQLNGHFRISTAMLQLDSIQITGHLIVANGDILIDDYSIENLNLRCHITKNYLNLPDATFALNGIPVSVTGQIVDIFNPEFNGSLTVEHFNPIPFLTDSTDLSEVKADLQVTSDFQITSERTFVDARFSSSKMSIASQRVESFRSQLIYDNARIEIKNIQFNSLDFQVNVNGAVDLVDGRYSVIIDSYRDFEEQLLLDNLTNATLNTRIKLHGDVFNKSLNGTWDYDLLSDADTLLCLAGIVVLDEGNFKFKQTKTSARENTLVLEISDIFNNPRINYGYIENPPLHIFTSRSWIQDFLEEHNIDAILSGPLNSLNLQFTIQNYQDPSRHLTLSSHVIDLLEKESHITGNIKFNGFQSSYNILFGRSFLRGSLSSGDYFSGDIDLELGREDQIQATIVLDQFPITKIDDESFLGQAGFFNGDINIGGTLDDPGFTAHINGDKFIINDIGYYKFDMTMSGVPAILNIDSLQIALNNVPVLSGFLNLDINANHLSARATGNQVDAEYIFQTLFPKSELITGKGEYSLYIDGPFKSPKIRATVQLQNGLIDGIGYDNLELALSDSITTDSSFLKYESHQLNIEKFEIVRGGHYHIIGNGNLPFYNNGQIDLKVNFDGDIFSFIPHWDSFFMDGACFASINMHVSGTPSKPRVLSGRAEIERGELWLKSVAKHVENISGVFEYNPESKTIYMSNIRAEVDGDALVINTIDSVTTSDGKELKPWYFEDLDLNFGILAMRTTGSGVKIEIEGFMLPGENGALLLSGKTSDEDFYFAGPVDHPTAWGQVVFSDSRFSFPFTPAGSSKPSPTIRFLRRVLWDVYVVPGENVQYVRAIPAFLGEVDTDLDLDAHTEGLNFLGVLDEETFHAIGELKSTRGRLEYLDLNFRVENFGVIFNNADDKPEVYGKAWTTVRDSVRAIPKTIYLELFAIDKNTGQLTTRSRWEDFRFRLVSADPEIGEAQEQVLAYLGYSVDNIKEKATQVGGAVTENYVIRPLLRPIERRLERYLGFDLVRFNSSIAKNLFLVSLGNRNDPGNIQNVAFYQDSFAPYVLLFESSEVTLGKYLSQDLYLTYTGQFVTRASEKEAEFNINHSLGVEYRFFKNILLEFEYYREALNYYQVYSDKSYLEDFKIRLRHSFSF
jgi:hypothetical protein